MGNSSGKQNKHVHDSQGDDQHESNSESKNDAELQSKIASSRSQMHDVLHRLKQTPGVESFLNGVSAQFSMFTGKTDVFESLEQQIASCETSFAYYKTLSNNDIVSTEYPERIKAALKIHQQEWKLLAETASMLQNIVFKIDSVKDAVEDFEDQMQESQPNQAEIQRCMQSFVSWTQNAKDLEELAKKWNDLMDDAQKEQTEWNRIKEEVKNKLLWKRIKTAAIWVGGFIVVAGIGFGITCALCPAILPWVAKEAAQEAAVITPKVAAWIIASVAGVAALGAVAGYNFLSKDIDQCKLVLKLSSQIRDEMAKAANNAKTVELMVTQLVDLMNEQAHSTNKIKNSCVNGDVSGSTPNQIKRIKGCLKDIKDSLSQFESQCKDLRTLIKTTQKNMIKD